MNGHPALRSANVRQLHQIGHLGPTGGLFREGISLRVRRSGTRLVQTMKLDGGRNGPFGRNEWAWPVRTEALSARSRTSAQ